ncbi:hypothetical protein QE363_000697 [Sphingomonas sp. SORGH_AS870]|uniref:hypothetical protein n=1 Tax=Sphingomonas sp. SORGH_AS_0870 TaxID=3041801 RepID=UPI00286186A6|nr:hypothetical protein [Sphingomonas sp. SORGH_AS_0870]MDR6144904.1 hypothetical protein [Sphingomonas sp. SORGH_AS_0870]
MTRSIKQLRFEYHPQPDESAIGALAAGCRDHRLVRVASALEGGAITIAKPGHVQLASADDAARLAHILRTDVDSIAAITFDATGSRSSIMLGELRMPRPAFDFLHRRIGPHSLKGRPHHRSAWLNRLLPYCPESFEHLVEACSKCGPLGWRRTRGIGNCESCTQTVPASDLPRLPERLELDYRLAADLMSRDPVAGRRAVNLLPSCLQTFSRTTLVDIMLKSGIMASELPTRWELDQLRSQSSEMVAEIIANGAGILRSWPDGIRDVVTRRMDTNVDDLVAYEEVRTEVRWIAKYSGDEGQAILALAFPHLDGRTAETFSSAARFYTATETNQRLWSSSVELGKLREADAIRFEPLPSRRRLRARYDADDVDELHRQLQAGETPGAAAGRFDLPVYAVGQLVTSGRLEIMPHPGVQVLRGYLIDRGRAEQLEGALTHGAKLPAKPSGAVSLRYAMMRYGGEKPWAFILEEMLEGRIDYHLPEGKAPKIRDIMVDLTRFPKHITCGTASADPLGLTHVSLRDAEEILGTTFYEAQATIVAAGLQVVPYGKGKGVARRELNSLAAQVAFTGEALARTALQPQALHRELLRMGAGRLHGAWSRQSLFELGLVDLLTTDRCKHTSAV